MTTTHNYSRTNELKAPLYYTFSILVGQPIAQPLPNCDACRLAFWSLLNQYKVDFYFAGHIHWMELLYPLDSAGNVVARDFITGDGVIHVTDGAGAAPSGFETPKTIDVERQAWLFSGYGFHQLLIQNSSHATLNFIDSATVTIIKSFDVIRRR
ncbi:unnamed protein product [Rotaria sp. Silwood1]|nr:unnamed protein product [Rotaria sp. Silwood1]